MEDRRHDAENQSERQTWAKRGAREKIIRLMKKVGAKAGRRGRRTGDKRSLSEEQS